MQHIIGEEQTSREYAPHMWILGPDIGGVPEDRWAFVGNDGNQFSFYQGTEYHIGVTAIGEMVCDGVARDNQFSGRYEYCGNIPLEDVPIQAFRSALDGALDANIAFPGRQVLIRELVRRIPDISHIPIEFPDGLAIAELITVNGIVWSPAEQLHAVHKSVQVLRSALGFENL